MTTPDLIGLSAEEFKEVVNADIRNPTDNPGVAMELRGGSHDIVQRWYDTLCIMKRDSERQLANYKNDRAIEQYRCLQIPNGKMEYQKWVASKAKWRTNVIRFKTGVEEKITEAKSCLRQFDEEYDYVG